MNFKQWFNSNYFDPLCRKYTQADKPEYTVADMQAAFEAGRQLEFDEEQLDQIADRATESMHQEFLAYDEPQLIKLHSRIPMGYIRHIISSIRNQ